jgi:RNA polymerase sigma-70 factor (ECF subfamily)
VTHHDPLAHPAPLIRRVYAYVAYRIGAGPDAEDVTGDVFERALRYRATYDPARGAPLPWLLGIAQRCIVDRASQPRVDRLEPERADDGIETETLLRLELAGALANLSPKSQELIALRYGADLKAKDIAQVVGLKTNAVEVALHRALAELRAELDQVADSRPPYPLAPRTHAPDLGGS